MKFLLEHNISIAHIFHFCIGYVNFYIRAPKKQGKANIVENLHLFLQLTILNFIYTNARCGRQPRTCLQDKTEILLLILYTVTGSSVTFKLTKRQAAQSERPKK